MTKTDAGKVLMILADNYDSFKPQDKAAKINLWAEAFHDDNAEDVMRAVWAVITTDPSEFAPTVGKVRCMMNDMKPSNVMNESAAWCLVYEALCNSNYHANEEFNKLPADVRRAVGGPDQLREWAGMDYEHITIAESNFKRTYRGVMELAKKHERMPQRLNPQLDIAPVAKIEEKTEENRNTERASNEYIDMLLEKWRADDPTRTAT